MDSRRIADLLTPFLATARAESAMLTPRQLDQISIYIDLLLRWNARISLTAIRTPEEIVTRHFGESLFAARHLLPCDPDTPCGAGNPAREGSCVSPEPSLRSEGPDSASLPGRTEKAFQQGAPQASFQDSDRTSASPEQSSPQPGRIVDLGSGAGFPGLPLKIWSPHTAVTLIESNQKKVAFLRETIRALTLTDIDVFPRRAQDYPAASVPLLTLRAVERFETILPAAARLLIPGGAVALLIGQSQVSPAQSLLPAFHWNAPLTIPMSSSRLLICATRSQEAVT
jgi:16S rRNA (guanine(527)-N(7))-methyltransferase RsmG